MNASINVGKIKSKKGYRQGDKAYDVNDIGTALGNGRWELRGYDDSGVDYFDGKNGHGIWSIGLAKDGKIIASLSAEFYMHPDYECLWLR